MALAFLWAFRWCFFFLVLESDIVAGVFFVTAGFAGAGFGAGLFLFCAANAVVPARAKANTALIRILFIFVLRRFFLAADSMDYGEEPFSSGQGVKYGLQG